MAGSGIAVGPGKGHSVTSKEKALKPSNRKGVSAEPSDYSLGGHTYPAAAWLSSLPLAPIICPNCRDPTGSGMETVGHIFCCRTA
eukprot:scaffold295225_cov32-Prasinocladus_malaysianus.AAC.1